jgi:hypothetical protein
MLPFLRQAVSVADPLFAPLHEMLDEDEIAAVNKAGCAIVAFAVMCSRFHQ